MVTSGSDVSSRGMAAVSRDHLQAAAVVLVARGSGEPAAAGGHISSGQGAGGLLEEASSSFSSGQYPGGEGGRCAPCVPSMRCLFFNIFRFVYEQHKSAVNSV